MRAIQSPRRALQPFLTPIQGKKYKYHVSSFTCIWFDLLHIYTKCTHLNLRVHVCYTVTVIEKKDVNRISVKFETC